MGRRFLYSSFPSVVNHPKYTHLYFPLKQLTILEKRILQNEVDYYQKLSDKNKKYFEHRVAKFLETHPIIPREGMKLTPQMRVLIASSSVSLTFGLKRYVYKSFNAILLYPDIYYSTITEQYHKGEFNPRNKVVVFSWEHFLEGIKEKKDNINLGFHEFAHALHFEMKSENHPNSYQFRKYFLMILHELKKTEKREKLLNTNYFRAYGFENKYEFLAVLVEHYFETPEVFEKEFPVFFQKVKKMLNQ